MQRRIGYRLAIVLAILAGVHYAIWSQVVAPLGAPWRAIGTVAIIAFGPTLPIGLIVSRRLSRAQARPYLWAIFVWFGLATYLFTAALIGMAVRAVSPFAIAPGAAAWVELLAALVLVLYGIGHVRRGPIVRRLEVPLAGLGVPAFTIVHLTDVHIGPLLGRAFAREIVAQVNALEPDLIVITGDLVDGRLDDLREHVEPLRELRAKHGTYAVCGNHEFYWNGEAWLAHLGGLGIHVLRNERVAIGTAFELAGTDDVTVGEDLDRALAGRDGARPVVLLAHHPRTIARAQAAGVGLQLSGHTHGGQLLPLGYLARLFEPRVAGLARFGRTWLYVSEGTGFWGPPMRIGTTSEIAAITLRPA